MNINDWVKEERDNLESFAVYWTENNRDKPELFPMEMPAGEWDEQYQAWSS